MKFSFLVLLIFLSACSAPQYQPGQALSDNVFAQLPNWYHDKVGLQLQGENLYPDSPHAILLQQADRAFMQSDLQACQIFLERAQRIETRDAGIYVRLSYLYWVQKKSTQALQTARRAYSVVGQDDSAKQEILRLIHAIQQNL